MISRFDMEASRLYPIPWSKPEPSDWQAAKCEHISYWTKRFGLTDARPFKMLPGKIRVRVTWKEITESSELLIVTQFSDQMRETHRVVYSDDAIFEYIIKLSKTYHLVYPDLSGFNPAEGETCLFSPRIPEHDWLVWKRDLLKGTHLKLKKKLVANAIRKYRKEKDFLDDLESLKQWVYENCV